MAGFFLINSSQRGEDRSQIIHAPAIYPPPLLPASPLVRARGEEVGGSASMLTHRPGEREWRGRGDQPGREGERGSNTSHSRDLSPRSYKQRKGTFPLSQHSLSQKVTDSERSLLE